MKLSMYSRTPLNGHLGIAEYKIKHFLIVDLRYFKDMKMSLPEFNTNTTISGVFTE